MTEQSFMKSIQRQALKDLKEAEKKELKEMKKKLNELKQVTEQPYKSLYEHDFLNRAPVTPKLRPSTMRTMSLISLIVGAGIAFFGLYGECKSDLTGLAFLCSVFVVPAFGGKAMQKHIEVKGRKQ